MHIGLIGMSGIGKSYWASKLADAGFVCLDCDNIIATKLSAVLSMQLATLHDVGQWMGFPYQPGYREREELYLTYEIDVLQGIIADFAQPGAQQRRVVVDLTGSVIYAGQDILAKLRQSMTIVYLALAPEGHEAMLQEYVNNPRPLVWRGMFHQELEESPASALSRCYPNLIAFREKQYEAYCDVKIEYQHHRQADFTVDDFLRCIHQSTGSAPAQKSWYNEN